MKKPSIQNLGQLLSWLSLASSFYWASFKFLVLSKLLNRALRKKKFHQVATLMESKKRLAVIMRKALAENTNLLQTSSD